MKRKTKKELRHKLAELFCEACGILTELRIRKYKGYKEIDQNFKRFLDENNFLKFKKYKMKERLGGKI